MVYYNNLFCSYDVDKHSLSINNLTIPTAVRNNCTVYNDSKQEKNDILTNSFKYGVSSSYLKRLSNHRIISGSLLQLQETVGQGMLLIALLNSY